MLAEELVSRRSPPNKAESERVKAKTVAGSNFKNLMLIVTFDAKLELLETR